MMVNIEHLKKYGIELNKITATGGGASSDKWLRIKADIIGKPIVSLSAKEVGACGTCMLTSIALGLCKDFYDARRIFVHEKCAYIPDEKNKLKYHRLYEAYKKIYNAIRPIIGEVYDE